MADSRLFCSNPECGEEVIGSGVIMSDGTDTIDWEALNIPHVLHTTRTDGEQGQALVLHQNCFMELFNALMRGEHTYVLNVAGGPMGEIKIAIGLEEDPNE